MHKFISLDDLPVAERYAYWRDVTCRELYSVTPSDWAGEQPFRAWNDIRDTARFGLSEFYASTARRSRTRQDIARDDAEFLILYRATGARQVFAFRDVTVTLDPGDFCIAGTEHVFDTHGRDGVSARTLIVPAAQISPLVTGGSIGAPRHVAGASPIGALLGAALDAAWSEVPRLPEAVADAVLANLTGLVALACRPSDEGRDHARHGVEQAQRDAILGFIERHFADPALTPARAAAALGMSKRRLHALLETSGASFAQAVTHRRLEACRRMLESPADGHRSVTDIAFGWGFSSLATFYRQFQAAYGVAPGDLRPTGSRPAGPR